MDLIAWLEYELAYYDSVVHRFNHYTTRIRLQCSFPRLITIAPQVPVKNYVYIDIILKNRYSFFLCRRVGKYISVNNLPILTYSVFFLKNHIKGNVSMWCYVSSEKFFSNKKMKWKIEKILSVLLLLIAFCFKMYAT